MKSNRKIKVLLLIVLSIIFTFLPSIEYNFNLYNGRNEIRSGFKETANLKISTISGKIHLDNNWSDSKIAGIC
ncbi:MAG: hypothetical protein ACXAAH_11925, partial [Promethearchaeota archaeon]